MAFRRINSAERAAVAAVDSAGFSFAGTTLTMAATLDMGSNKITNLTNGSGAADVAAFGQVGSGVSGTEPVDIQSVYFDDLNNTSGGTLDKGMIVTFDTAADGIIACPTNAEVAIGVLAEDSLNGAAAKVVYAGRIQVLIDNTAVRGNYVRPGGNNAGMGSATANGQPPALGLLEGAGSGGVGTEVLIWCQIGLQQEVY
jgi:hypothetical protein